jgi:hypothetical protein
VTVSGAGKPIHHNDCTWCRHRVSLKGAIQKKYELELCGLTEGTLLHPNQARRFCESYQQANCGCNSCRSNVQ